MKYYSKNNDNEINLLNNFYKNKKKINITIILFIIIIIITSFVLILFPYDFGVILIVLEFIMFLFVFNMLKPKFNYDDWIIHKVLGTEFADFSYTYLGDLDEKVLKMIGYDNKAGLTSIRNCNVIKNIKGKYKNCSFNQNLLYVYDNISGEYYRYNVFNGIVTELKIKKKYIKPFVISNIKIPKLKFKKVIKSNNVEFDKKFNIKEIEENSEVLNFLDETMIQKIEKLSNTKNFEQFFILVYKNKLYVGQDCYGSNLLSFKYNKKNLNQNIKNLKEYANNIKELINILMLN